MKKCFKEVCSSTVFVCHGVPPYTDTVISTKHKEGDSGFETFLFEPCDASLVTSFDPALKRDSAELQM